MQVTYLAQILVKTVEPFALNEVFAFSCKLSVIRKCIKFYNILNFDLPAFREKLHKPVAWQMEACFAAFDKDE